LWPTNSLMRYRSSMVVPIYEDSDLGAGCMDNFSSIVRSTNLTPQRPQKRISSGKVRKHWGQALSMRVDSDTLAIIPNRYQQGNLIALYGKITAKQRFPAVFLDRDLSPWKTHWGE
jgi:hypothetical protein